MWLNVAHVTHFAYDSPINDAYTEVRLKPQHRDGQRCSSFVLETEPRGGVHEYVDRFGNAVHHFDVLEPHDELVVTMRSEVWTADSFASPEQELSLLDRHDYLAATRFIPLEGSIAALAAEAAAPGDGLETARAIMHAVRGSLTYERGTTGVHTRADEALAEGRGVCQDFAHVFVGACRARSLPARYVSGYLHDPNGNGGRSASHAWADVFVEGPGWVSLDPTNDREQTDHYVRVAVGRDYADVPPSRGVYVGNAAERLDVAVRIAEP